MKLLKKTIASIALVTLVSSLFTTGAFAYSEAEKTAADSLAAKGIIVAKADAAGYNLDQNVLRQEIAAVARGVAGVDKKTTCANSFKDVTATTPNNWACYSVEALLDAGLIASNENFRPEANITKAEAVGMMVKAAYGTEYAYNNALGTSWQEQVVAFAVEKGIIASFTNYEALATRGFVFEVGASALSGEGDDLSDLMDDLLGEDEDEDDTTSTGTTDETVVSGDNVLTVSLAADTPESASVPAGVNGLAVAAYDFTAGSEDVTVTSIILKRRGLSDSNTLTGLAAFSDEGRASKAKDDSQESNTEATLTLTNGFVIKAGETRALTIVADINSALNAANDEFSIELKEVTTSSDVETSGSLVGNTFRVGSVDAATLDINTNGTVSNPKIGEEGISILKFEVKGDSDDDVVLNSVTFKSDSSDAEEDLINFSLLMGTKEVATTAAMNDKYLTFTFDEGITIGKGKNEKFTVTADVVAGAGDSIAWYIDKNLDVQAEDTKYGFGAAIDITDVDATGDLGTIVVQAGELTLVDVDPSSDQMRENKDDVTLGKIKVTNIAGKSLELQKLGVLATLTAGTAYVDTDGDGIRDFTDTADTNATEDDNIPVGDDGIYTAGEAYTEAALTLATLFENFELYNEDEGTSYELDLVGSVYQDLDLNITLPQGETNFLLRADTKDKIGNFDTASVDLSIDASLNAGKTADANALNGQFFAVETEDDKPVTDLTPSSLTWKKMKGSESGASLSLVPLSDLTKVRGAKGVVGLQFEIKAEDSSELNIDELKVYVEKDTDNGNASRGAATNSTISQVTLYKGSVSESNLLDRVSGSNLASGYATFDSFEVNIAASARQTFIVTVDFVDGADTSDVLNSPYALKITSTQISAEDEDNDDVVITGGTLTSAREIAVSNFGTVTITEDANNDDNTDPKTILGGTSKKVFSVDVQASNENVDVETVKFVVDQDIKNAVVNASLYLGDTLIATNSNSDFTVTAGPTATTIAFNDLSTLIIPQETKELKLMLNTATMGFEKVGATVLAINVTEVHLEDIEGADSGKAIADVTDTSITSDQLTNIVPAVITPSSSQNLSSSSSQAKLKITADYGSNTVTANNSTPTTSIDTITFSAPGASGVAAADYVLYEEGKSGVQVRGKASGTNVVFDFNDLNGDGTTGDAFANGTLSSSKTYVIVPTLTSGDTASLTLLKNGIQYDVTGIASATNITTQLINEIDFGTRSID